METLPTKTAVILAGGRSRRFGSDKLAHPIDGKTMPEILAGRLVAASFKIILAGPEKKLARLGFPVIEDETPFNGPLAVLARLFDHLKISRLLLVAADMPFLLPSVAQALWTRGARADVVMAEDEKGVSPLPGVYSARAAMVAGQLLEKGEKSLKALLGENVTKTFLALGDLEKLDPSRESLININQRGDFENACPF